jgi:hypothetical protein
MVKMLPQLSTLHIEEVFRHDAGGDRTTDEKEVVVLLLPNLTRITLNFFAEFCCYLPGL